VPFLRFTRDKRGYEHFQLVEPVRGRRGRERYRVLFVFRTPPNIKVGRAPFSEEVQKILEQHYPQVTFDWRKLMATPIPSADAERWRERRRAERAQRAAAELEEDSSDEELQEAGGPPGSESAAEPEPPSAESMGESEEGARDEGGADRNQAEEPVVQTLSTPAPAGTPSSRRRRRRRRRRADPANPAASPQAAQSSGDSGSKEKV
jgi:hypothetical protein